MSALVNRPRPACAIAILTPAIVIVAIFTATTARATVTFVGGDGAPWSAPVWTGGIFQFPVPGEDAALGAFSPARNGNVTVNFDLTYGAALNSLTINASGLTTGTMTVSQTTAGTVMWASSEVIGSNAVNSVYTQTTGTNNAGSLTLGQLSGGLGVYNLGGNGILTATSETLGAVGSGVGSISQSGGTNTIAVSGGTGKLMFGLGTSGTNSYFLSGGTLTTDFVSVGVVTGGSISQSGGTMTINSGLDVAVGSASSGGYNLNIGGALTAPSEIIADHGNGSMTQGNGTTNTVSGNLSVGLAVGGTGIYQLIGGGLATGNETLGNFGIGNFTQSAGTHTVATTLNIGNTASGKSIYTFQAGALTVGGAATGTVVIGGSGATGGSGAFNQSGGNFMISGAGGSLTVGGGPGAGVFTLSGSGGLNAPLEFIGGNGTFTHSGGTNAVSGTLSLNASSAGNASYVLNGSGVLVAPTVQIARNATFSQDTGTTNTISSLLDIGGVSGATGTYVQTGGALTVYSHLVGTTNGDAGIVNHTGGTTTITNLLGLGNFAATSTGTYNLGGAGTLTATAASAQIIVGNGGVGLLNQTGGTLNARNVSGAFVTNAGGTYHQSGGAENGYFLNGGTFMYDGGTFNGKLENDGAVTLTATLTAGGGVLNNATINIAVGAGLGAANGAMLDNESTLNLAGGSLTGAGAIVSNAAMSGYGTIGGTGGFTNNGLMSISGGQLAIANSGANANNGNLAIASGRQLQLTGSGLTNTGTLSLSTSTVNGSATLTNAAGGSISGTGLISAPLVNAAGGVISNGGPGTLTVTPAFTNAGLIQLAAYNATIGGGTITNTGSIQGLGIVGNPVNNTGTVEAISGTLSLSGTFQNQAGGLIRVGAGNKLLVAAGLGAIGGPTSFVNNAGIINLIGGTFDNNGHPLINGGQISGYGTFATGGTGLDNDGSITFSGGLTTVNGAVTNENGKTITIAQNPAIFTGLVTNNGGATFNTINATATFAGGFTNNGNGNFAAVGNGAIDVPVVPTLGNASSMAIDGSSTMKFSALSGAASVGSGVTATVSSGAVLELAGSVSAFSNGFSRVNVTNNSTAAAGVLVSGMHQQVGNIDGSGTTQVNAGSDLTVDHIIQAALMIGGMAGSPGFVTIAASDASGSPLGQSTGIALAASLTPSSLFGAPGISATRLSAATTDGADLAVLAMGRSVGSDSPAPVPEPTTLLLSLLAVLGVVSTQFAKALQHSRFHS